MLKERERETEIVITSILSESITVCRRCAIVITVQSLKHSRIAF